MLHCIIYYKMQRPQTKTYYEQGHVMQLCLVQVYVPSGAHNKPAINWVTERSTHVKVDIIVTHPANIGNIYMYNNTITAVPGYEGSCTIELLHLPFAFAIHKHTT